MLRRLLAAGDWVALIARALRGHRGDLDDRRRRRSSGRSSSAPAWILVRQAPRALRQRPPADPPQHPRRGALAGLGQRARHAGARRPAGAQPGRAALAEERDRARHRHPGRQLRPPRRAALRLAPADRGRDRHRDRAPPAGRHGRPPRRHPPGDAPAPGRLPLGPARRGRRPSCRGSARSPTSPRWPRAHDDRARRRHRTGDERAAPPSG